MGTVAYSFTERTNFIRQPDKPEFLTFLESAKTILRYVDEVEKNGGVCVSATIDDVKECCGNILTSVIHYENTCTKSQSDDDRRLFGPIQLALKDQNAKPVIVRMRIKKDLHNIDRDTGYILDCVTSSSRLYLFLKRAEKILSKASYRKLK